MMHWLVVGHFDPLDPCDMSEKPYRLKPLKAISSEAVERAEAEFGADVHEFVSYGDGGYFCCNWSLARYELWDRVRQFAYFLAKRENAVVMDERHMVWWPADASKRQQQAWGWNDSDELGASAERGRAY